MAVGEEATRQNSLRGSIFDRHVDISAIIAEAATRRIFSGSFSVRRSNAETVLEKQRRNNAENLGGP